MDVRFVDINGKRHPVYFGMREHAMIEAAQMAFASFEGGKAIDNVSEAFASATRNGARKIGQPELGLSVDDLVDLVDGDPKLQDKFWDVYEEFLPKADKSKADKSDADKKKASNTTS